MATKQVKLIGGSRNGETVEVESWQQLVYMKKRISMKEAEELKIDECCATKGPDEVYCRGKDGAFSYSRTVNY